MIKIILFFVIIPFLVQPITAQEWHDGEVSKSLEKKDFCRQHKISEDYISFYQHYFSKIRGTECPMYPSCSNYGLKVFKDKPFIEAMLYTADRITRCGHDKKYYNETLQYEKFTLLDWPSYEKTPEKLIFKGTRSFYTDSKNNHDETSFINYLINHKQYEVALLEITRELYFKKRKDPIFFKNQLLCYEALEREEDGVYEYEINFPKEIQKNSSVAIKAAKLYYNINNYQQAIKTLDRIQDETKESYYKKNIFKSIIKTKQEDYVSAYNILENIQTAYPEYNKTCLQNKEMINNISKIHLKKPIIAQVFSIIPGCGYLYTKQHQTAITTLLINAVLAYATFNSIKKENYGMATLTGLFSLTFYIGNIIGAGKSANRYNKHIIDTHITKLTKFNGIDNY